MTSATAFGAGSGTESLSAVWKHEGESKALKSWSFQEAMSGTQQLTSQEKDPLTGKVSQFKGPSLSALVDAALKSLTPGEKAQIDLVILKSSTGAQALIPRAFVVKYPLYLATSRDLKSLGSHGPFYSVAPWTSNSAIKKEGMSLESLFVPQISQIEFANYRERYSSLYLKRRADPAAMRGEKLFVQNCLSCHTSGPGASVADLSEVQKTRALATSGHPRIKGAPQLGEKDVRSLTSYLEAYHTENVASQTGGAHVQAVSQNSR
ncbi:MAG: cytochrome c [Methylotenera sp.]|nr:cytochrome c [Oligoflexia bacterium]